jgi:hypothetical protein
MESFKWVIELRFHPWDVDRYGDRDLIPFHVKLSIKGLPQHVWFQVIANKILGDAALIHHVDPSTCHREDQCFYMCWAFCQNPSRIPQLVYLTLYDRHEDSRLDVQMHFSRPRNVKKGCTFTVLLHINSIKDLMFYQHPSEQLVAEGRV